MRSKTLLRKTGRLLAGSVLGLLIAEVPAIAQPTPPHVIIVTTRPNGTPNPANSGEDVQLSVLAVDSLGHPLNYRWTIACNP